MTLSEVIANAVTVSYRTSDVSATAGLDYTSTMATLTINANERTGTIRVPIADDDAAEDEETFTVTLFGAVRATIADGEGIGTITDDDGDARPPRSPSLSIGDAVVPEGAGSAVFPVSVSPVSAAPVTVTYVTRAVTATAGVDYNAVKGTLTLAAGAETGTIRIRILDDNPRGGRRDLSCQVVRPVECRDYGR